MSKPKDDECGSPIIPPSLFHDLRSPTRPPSHPSLPRPRETNQCPLKVFEIYFTEEVLGENYSEILFKRPKLAMGNTTKSFHWTKPSYPWFIKSFYMWIGMCYWYVCLHALIII